MKLEGTAEFKKALNKAFREKKKGAKNGVRLATAFVKATSTKQTPVDTGHLRGSHYTSVVDDRKGVIGEVGLTAEYAIYVHENTAMAGKGLPRRGKHAKGKYWDPKGSTAKFLQKAIYENTKRLFEIIKSQIK